MPEGHPSEPDKQKSNQTFAPMADALPKLKIKYKCQPDQNSFAKKLY